MKVFAITTDLVLTEQPSWFEEVREKYNQSLDLHITLKQPCFIDDTEIPAVKEKISRFFITQQFHAITLSFDQVIFDKEERGWTIMLTCTSSEIMDLQKRLCAELSSYATYVKPETEEYERNFVPHMTFAAHLSEDQYEEAKTMFSDHYACQGIVTKGFLLVASEDAKEVLEQVEYRLL